jgi:hypothetical protein
MSVQHRVLETGLVIQAHLHVAGALRKAELEQVRVPRQGGEAEFLNELLRYIAGIDRPLFMFRKFVDPADS